MLWKITVFLWIVLFALRKYIKITATDEDIARATLGIPVGMTPSRIAYTVLLIMATFMSLVTAFWLLFIICK